MACEEMQEEMNKESGNANDWIGKVVMRERLLEEK